VHFYGCSAGGMASYCYEELDERVSNGIVKQLPSKRVRGLMNNDQF
jgi:hypothetical protein